jgi:hypothetical protein
MRAAPALGAEPDALAALFGSQFGSRHLISFSSANKIPIAAASIAPSRRVRKAIVRWSNSLWVCSPRYSNGIIHSINASLPDFALKALQQVFPYGPIFL